MSASSLIDGLVSKITGKSSTDPQSINKENIPDSYINGLDSLLNGFVEGSFGALSDPIAVLWKGMFILFIGFYGYKVIARGEFSTREMLVHTGKMILILILATRWAEFQLFFMELITNTPSEIAMIILNANPTEGVDSHMGNINTALGKYLNDSLGVASKIFSTAGLNIGMYLFSFAVAVIGYGLTGYALLLISIAKIAVAILLSVAPFFILMLIFNQSKNLFQGWLQTLANYSLVPLFTYLLLALMLHLSKQPLKELTETMNIGQQVFGIAAPFVVTSVVSIGMLSQVSNMAASIAGGINLDTSMATEASKKTALWGARKLLPHLGKGLDKAAKATTRGAKSAWNKGQEMGKSAWNKGQEIGKSAWSKGQEMGQSIGNAITEARKAFNGSK